MCLITVIMSTYNETRKQLDQSINSILNQSFTRFNFIIVDDNPNSRVLKNYLINKRNVNKCIHLLFNKKNVGLVRSLNKAIKHSHSYFIARMDADDVATKNRFSQQLSFIKKYNLDFVFPNGRFLINNHLSKKSYFYNINIINQQLIKYSFSHYSNFAIHSGWMVKTKIYKELYGYRNINDAEDFDFLLRALVHHYKLGYDSHILIYRRIRADSISDKNVLPQFISLLALQKYVKKTKFSKIMPMSFYVKYKSKYITNDSKKEFNMFIRCKNKFRHQFNIKNFMRFILSICMSINVQKNIICMIKRFLLKRIIYLMAIISK